MSQAVAFGDVLDAADRLTPDEQEALIEILHRRLAQAGRQRIAAEVQEAQDEFVTGQCQPVSPDDLMREVLS